jgi:hypothetical protein
MATCSSSPPTYEKILNRHGLKRQEMKRRCSGDELFPIAREMTRWRSINLGLQKGVINSIENDPTTGEEEKQIKLLERWSESYGHDATYDRLAYSFCSSNRVDLADVVCEMRKKGYQVPLPASDSLSEETETEGNVQPFVTAEEATTTDEGAVDDRGIPPGQAESIGAGQKNRPSTVSEKGQIPEEKKMGFNQSGWQEQSDGQKSTPIFAISLPSMEQKSPQTKPLPPKHAPAESPKALEMTCEALKSSLTHIDKLREERETMTANSEKKVRELLDRNITAVWMVVEKDRQIQALKGETKDMQERLTAEQKKSRTVKGGLVERDKKISELEDDIQQRDKELEQVKDNQQKLTEVREQLLQARGKLSEETRMKNGMEHTLSRTSKRIKHLEASLKKANTNVDETVKERECLENIVQWTKDEIASLHSKLLEKEDEIAQLRKQKRIYRVAFVIVVIILACLVLSRVPITRSHLFGGHAEL